MENSLDKQQPQQYSLSLSGSAITVANDDEFNSYPTEIGGQPVKYLWKDIARLGTFIKPSTKQVVNLRQVNFDRWLSNFDKMQTNGRKVYLPIDHSESADDNRGYVVKLKQIGDKMMGLLQCIGDDAAKTAARNDVSVLVKKPLVDSTAVYDEAIQHVALTPDPVVTGLDSATVATSLSNIDKFDWSNSMTLTTTQDQIDKIKRYLPNGGTLNAEGILDGVCAHLEKMSMDDDTDAGGAMSIAALSRAEIIDKASLNRKAAFEKAKLLESKSAEMVSLSKQLPKALDPDVKDTLLDAVKIKSQFVIGKGALSPAVAEAFVKRLTSTDYALSKTSGVKDGPCLVIDLLNILADNHPMKIGAETGIQVLSNSVITSEEREKTEKENKLKAMRERMTNKAK